MSVNIRRAVARWHLDDMSIVQAAGRPIDSDYVFILLGMFSHKMLLIIIFVHKHFRQK